ncbi:hypothetical protein [Spiroplasma poulsonii]|uniref:hypothetical protein n=1 Tax=Spiroplasma poulsonii TaxID=2138 RepID=UPI001F4C7CB3|nr:hypothetical protein [Spiroplasma poulsonii]UNF62240.1 hypothetical protein MNU24_01920 [Spiroplasma poulsonii]
MIILMIKLLLLMLNTELQSNAQKDKNNLILVKRKTHDQNTSNYRTRNQKIIATSFFARKHDYALFSLKLESKFQF